MKNHIAISLCLPVLLFSLSAVAESFYDKIHKRPNVEQTQGDGAQDQSSVTPQSNNNGAKTSYTPQERQKAVGMLDNKAFMDDSFTLNGDDLKEMKMAWLMCSMTGFQGDTCKDVKKICLSKWKPKRKPTLCI